VSARVSSSSAVPAFDPVLASWSMSPLCTPTPTFSARWHSCASASGSTGSSSTASATATSERGGRGQPGADRHVAGEDPVEAAHRAALLAQHLDDGGGVAPPALRRAAAGRQVDLDRPLVGEVERAQPQHGPAGPAGQDGGELEGDGQHPALVHVGVLADEVRAAGCPDEDVRVGGGVGEQLLGAGGVRVAGHGGHPSPRRTV
jgi:hypothetical protein